MAPPSKPPNLLVNINKLDLLEKVLLGFMMRVWTSANASWIGAKRGLTNAEIAFKQTY
jgi:hypothetical protein